MEAIAPYPGDQPITRERIIIARKWAQFYGGLTAYREDSTYFFSAPLLSPEYTAATFARSTGQRVLAQPAAGGVPERRLQGRAGVSDSVVMFMGRHDYTTPAQPTDAGWPRLKAPYKQAVWFEHSSHMIPWEEPGKMLLSLVQQRAPIGRAGR